MENYYHILGVSPDVPTEQIKSRYRFLVKAYHPDRFSDPDTKAQAEEEMKRINAAYAVLSDPQKRAEYDRKMAHGSSSGSPAGDTTTQEEEFLRQAQEILLYLKGVETRWKHLLDPFPENAALKEAKRVFLRIISDLLERVYPGHSYDLVNSFHNKLNFNIYVMLSRNICVGAEFERNGLPGHFNRFDILVVTTMEVHELIFQLVEAARKQPSIRENELQEVIDRSTKNLFVLCDQSQAIGRAAVRPRANPAAAGAAGYYQSRPSSPPAKDRNAASTADMPFCQVCGQLLPTKEVTFRQNIGVVFMRFSRKVEGFLCASCIERYFWEMTGITLLLGWWGMISFITTPFILLLNLFNYLGSWGLRKSASDLGAISIGWKLLIFAILCAVTSYLVFSNPAGQPTSIAGVSSNQTNRLTATRTVRPAAVKSRQPTATLRSAVSQKPTDTPVRCLSWSQVSAADEGKFLCVQGTVRSAYWGDERTFYLSFSENANAFRLLVLDGYYFEDVQGNCVMTEGVVKTYGKMPYIEVGDRLSGCDY